MEKQLEGERAKANSALDKELNDKRAAATKELNKQLKEEQAKAKGDLEKDLAGKRSAAEKELEIQLEDERAKAQSALDKELADIRSDAIKGLEQELDDEKAQAQEGLEDELLRMRTEVMQNLNRKIEEGSLIPPVGDIQLEETEKDQPEGAVKPSSAPQDTDQPAGQDPAPEPPADIPFVNLAITQMQVYQPQNTAEPLGRILPGQSLSSILNSSEEFALVVDFELSEESKSEIANLGVTYYVQLFAQDRDSGSKFHLGDSQTAQFSEQSASYSAPVTDISLDRGAYDLSAFVAIQNGRQIIDYRQISFIQIT